VGLARRALLSRPSDDELVVALARAAVERAAPEELELFPVASAAYLEGRDPSRAVRGDATRAFPVDTAVVLLTPVALTVAKDVLGFLGAQLAKHAAKHGEEAIDWLVERLLGRGDDKSAGKTATQPGAVVKLTDEQLDQVRKLAIKKARQLELPAGKAKLLADALVGSLATG
jgi:hypothetical protein